MSFPSFYLWFFSYFINPEFLSLEQTIVVTLLLASVLGFLLVSTVKTCPRSKQPPLPPGPTPWPIIGNLPEIWKNKPVFRWIHSLMKELDTQIACIRVANTYIIPVTSPTIAEEFLKKYDSIFATRPLTMASEYSSRGYLTIAVEPQGDQWKKMKKVVASHIVSSASFRWQLGKRTEEADNLVRFINSQCTRNCDSSALVDLRLATRQYCGNVIRKLMFSIRFFGKGGEDGGPGFEEVEHVESLFAVLNHLYSFALSDYVPWLRPLDLEGHEKIVSEAMRTVNKYNDPLVEARVQQWRDGKRKEPEDLLDKFLLAKDSNGNPALSVEEIKAQVTELMLATVDNPSNAVEWAMAEMMNQPKIFQKAIDELDTIVGKDRLVQESDLPKLNYIKACAKEAFRLHPLAPFNVPHVSTADAVVAGYFIPKGSHVLISRVGLGRNPGAWQEPLSFKPERHLEDGDEPVELTDPNLRLLSFSTGRRGCMGVTLGSAMTSMLLARLVQGFTWTVPGGGSKIETLESDKDLFMAKPLHLQAKPRLAPSVYPK